MNFNLTTILAIVCALAIAASVFLFKRLGTVKRERDAATRALQVESVNAHVVTKYVKELVEIPGPAVVRERIVRLCVIPSVPDQSGADGAAGADAPGRLPDGSGRFLEQLSAELGAVQRNRRKAEALQAELAPQLPAE